MKSGLREFRWVWAVTMAVLLGSIKFTSAAASVPPPLPGASKLSPPLPPLPPLPSLPKSPIIFFRQLLESSAGKRAELLANKAPEHRRILERNLEIYDKMPAADRELRLHALELRHYFNAVSRGPSSNRVARLKGVPVLYRRAVADRLAYWDQLPADLQQQVQGYEQLTRTLSPGTVRGLSSASAIQSSAVQSNAVVWYSLPVPRRQQVQDTFNRVFSMTDAERGEAVREMTGKLSPAEREQMEKTLETFRKLPKAQRDRAVRGFQKFAGMSLEEQRQFFRSVQVWEKMSAEDREKWRALVAKLPPMPPTPPGFNAPPFPPMPRPLPPPTALATNAN